MFALTCGSKANQYSNSKKPEQFYPERNNGISHVRLTQSKVVVTIDHIIRVYSFDANKEDSD